MGRARQVITFDEVVHINRRSIQSNGGFAFVPPQNLLNGDSLFYILGILDQSLFGQQLYPSVQAKAAALGWHIIRGHVFNDGNKRTGLLSCAAVLALEGISLMRGDPDAEAVEITLRVADGSCPIEKFTEWVIARTAGD